MPTPDPLRDRQRRQRVRDEVAAGRPAGQPTRPPWRANGELRAGQPMALDVGRADVCGRSQAEGPHLGPRELGHGGDARIVGVEDGQPVGRERGGQLGLGARDSLDAPRALEVRRVHGEHDADLGPRDLREPRDLADRVHAHLEDGGLVRGLQPKQGHRQPGLGVEVALVAERDQRARQDVGRDLLRDRLARRAGDADDAHRVPRPPPGGEVLEGAKRVRHDDLGDVAQVIGEVDLPLDERCGGTRTEGVGDECVAVGALARKGDEDGSGGHATRVDRRAGDRGRGVRKRVR